MSVRSTGKDHSRANMAGLGYITSRVVEIFLRIFDRYCCVPAQHVKNVCELGDDQGFVSTELDICL